MPLSQTTSVAARIDWNDLRAEMPIARRWAYFDHAAVAPITRAAHEAMRHWVDEALYEGDILWPQWHRRAEEARQLGARLLNADESEIALVRNTTQGINLVAEGFPFESGDNIVTLANEFPSNLYPWLNQEPRGVECRVVPVEEGRVDLQRIADHCDARTRLIAISWVGYASGWRSDPAELAALAHDRGALLFLDAIQGLGMFPLDVKESGVDFLAADGHKWLLGPEGAGLFYCRHEHLDLLRPTGVGWNSVKHSHDFSRIDLDLRNTAERFEGGTPNMPGFIGFAASLKCLLHYGPERIEQRLLALTDALCRRLTEAGAAIHSCREPQRASGIVSFSLPGVDPTEFRAQALQHGVALSARSGRLRASPHAYTNEADIARLADLVRNALN